MRALKVSIIFILIALSMVSCSSNGNSTNTVLPLDYSCYRSVKAGDFAAGELEAHYAKHGYQFGSITQNQYLDNARAILDACPNSDLLEKTRSNGDILHYRISTGEFAVETSDGRIRTYFKTDYNYWLRQ